MGNNQSQLWIYPLRNKNIILIQKNPTPIKKNNQIKSSYVAVTVRWQETITVMWQVDALLKLLPRVQGYIFKALGEWGPRARVNGREKVVHKNIIIVMWHN